MDEITTKDTKYTKEEKNRRSNILGLTQKLSQTRYLLRALCVSVVSLSVEDSVSPIFKEIIFLSRLRFLEKQLMKAWHLHLK